MIEVPRSTSMASWWNKTTMQGDFSRSIARTWDRVDSKCSLSFGVFVGFLCSSCEPEPFQPTCPDEWHEVTGDLVAEDDLVCDDGNQADFESCTRPGGEPGCALECGQCPGGEYGRITCEDCAEVTAWLESVEDETVQEFDDCSAYVDCIGMK